MRGFHFSKRLIRIVAMALILLGVPFGRAVADTTLPADQCDISGVGVSACPANPQQAIGRNSADNPNVVNTYDAIRSAPGPATTPIDSWGYCRYLDNNSANNVSIFVPFKSLAEWNAFTTKGPNYISMVPCARPVSAAQMVAVPALQIPDNFPTYPGGAANPYYSSSAAACDRAQAATVNLPYARAPAGGTSYGQIVSFTCGSPAWTQSATATYTAFADNDPPAVPRATGGWQLTGVSYSGAPAAINGQCGANPGTCTAGTPVNVSDNGTVTTWTCNGLNGGSNRACSVSDGGGGGGCGGTGPGPGPRPPDLC